MPIQNGNLSLKAMSSFLDAHCHLSAVALHDGDRRPQPFWWLAKFAKQQLSAADQSLAYVTLFCGFR